MYSGAVVLAAHSMMLVQKTTKEGVRAKGGESKPTQTWRALPVSRMATAARPAMRRRGCQSPGGRSAVAAFASEDQSGTALVMGWLFVLPSSLYAGQLSSLSRRQAKSALLFINVVSDPRVLERHVFPRLADLKTLANRLDELGYLRPRLIPSAVAEELVDPRFDSNDLARLGEFERLVETGPKQITAAGWALNSGRTQPADAILLSAMDANRQHRLFVLSNGVILRPDLVKRFADPLYDMAGWSIVYGTVLTPEQIDAVEFRAWALDCDTGKLRALPGKPRIARPHQAPAAP